MMVMRNSSSNAGDEGGVSSSRTAVSVKMHLVCRNYKLSEQIGFHGSKPITALIHSNNRRYERDPFV